MKHTIRVIAISKFNSKSGLKKGRRDRKTRQKYINCTNDVRTIRHVKMQKDMDLHCTEP